MYLVDALIFGLLFHKPYLDTFCKIVMFGDTLFCETEYFYPSITSVSFFSGQKFSFKHYIMVHFPILVTSYFLNRIKTFFVK